MVSWNEIRATIDHNPNPNFHIPNLTIPLPAGTVERLPIPRIDEPEKETEKEKEITRNETKPKEKEKEKRSPILDPIVLGMEDTVELYNGSSVRSKHQMECEEAQSIEARITELYKSQGGRSRGWTKAMLEEMIQPRCASGGDIRELDKSKKAFVWQLVGDEKVYSAFLDFLCVAKSIRVAVWFDDETEKETDKRVVLYPAADVNTLDTNTTVRLYNVTSKGMLRNKQLTCEELVSFCTANQIALMPPLSVLHALSGLTLSELESVGKQLGMATVEGSKKERVANIAVYKLRKRLGVE